jgi:hypothetical protein
MVTLPKRPPGVMPTDPSSPSTTRDAVRWNDPEDVRLWIASLRAAAEDAVAAGEDATRPKRDRVLSRAETRRKLEAAEQMIATLLDAGDRSLALGSAA